MTRQSENPRGIRRMPDDFRVRTDPALPAASGFRSRSGRRLGPPLDAGTVALAMTGMAFYWLPIMSARRRRPKRNAPPPSTGQ
jgi:hypothetical protein